MYLRFNLRRARDIKKACDFSQAFFNSQFSILNSQFEFTLPRQQPCECGAWEPQPS